MRACLRVRACVAWRGMAWHSVAWRGVRVVSDGSSQGALQLLHYAEVHQTALDVGVESQSAKQRAD